MLAFAIPAMNSVIKESIETDRIIDLRMLFLLY